MIANPIFPEAKRSKHERLLLLIFLFAFTARLLERLRYWVDLAQRPLTFNDYPFTEWLINYQAGFYRRGLPGEFLLSLWRWFHVPPQLAIVTLCLMAYAAFCAYVWTISKDKVPRWVLFTTPVLGYPVFINGIMLRKDIFVVFVIAIVSALIIRSRSRGTDFVAFSLLAALILSHEIAFFLGFFMISLLLLLREYCLRKPGNPMGIPWRPRGIGTFFAQVSPWLIPLLIPLAAFASVVVRGRASLSAAKQMASPWASAYDPALPFPGPAGAMTVITESQGTYIDMALETLKMNVHGFPYWLILAVSMVSGVILLAAAFACRSQVRAWFFVYCALGTYFFMVPLFYYAPDFGRWVVLCLMVPFLLTIQTPIEWQERITRSVPLPERLENFSLPFWCAPVGLAFWGLSVVVWCPLGAPIGLLAQIYFYLRVFGLIPSLSTLQAK